MSKILTTYFSASGVTKAVAERIAEVTGGDLFEIEPVDQYTDEDLNWHDNNSRSSKEMNDSSSRPAIKNRVTNLANYDTILIGFPIWWGEAPRIINTFIEENDLSGKQIYIFATSGSSGVENSLESLKNTYDDIDFIDARRFNPSVSDDEIKNWLNR